MNIQPTAGCTIEINYNYSADTPWIQLAAGKVTPVPSPANFFIRTFYESGDWVRRDFQVNVSRQPLKPEALIHSVVDLLIRALGTF